jgi:hypothetical protein
MVARTGHQAAAAVFGPTLWPRSQQLVASSIIDRIFLALASIRIGKELSRIEANFHVLGVGWKGIKSGIEGFRRYHSLQTELIANSTGLRIEEKLGDTADKVMHY